MIRFNFSIHAFLLIIVTINHDFTNAFLTREINYSHHISSRFIILSYSNEEEIPTAATTISRIKRSNVLRHYETYHWKGYKINYRVEEKEEKSGFSASNKKNKTPILLIHGFGGNINHYRFQFPVLQESGYKVYAIDLLGFGASDKPGDFPYSIEKYSELCADFCEDMKETESWILAGNSIGGLCSLATADELLQRNKVASDASNATSTKACILFNCSGGMSIFRYEDIPIYFRPMLWFFQNVILGPQFGGNFFENFKTRSNVEMILKGQGVYQNITNVDEELLDLILTPSDDKGAKDVFLAVFGGPPGPTPESILPRLENINILALWGDSDPWTPANGGLHPGTKFGAYMTDSSKYTLEIIPGAGHCPHDEYPDIVNEMMIKWLSKL